MSPPTPSTVPRGTSLPTPSTHSTPEAQSTLQAPPAPPTPFLTPTTKTTSPKPSSSVALDEDVPQSEEDAVLPSSQPAASVPVDTGRSQFHDAARLASLLTLPHAPQSGEVATVSGVSPSYSLTPSSSRLRIQSTISSTEHDHSKEVYSELGQLTSSKKELYIFLSTTDDLLCQSVDKGKKRQVLAPPIEIRSRGEDDGVTAVIPEVPRKRGPGRPRKHVRPEASVTIDAKQRQTDRVPVDDESDEAYKLLNVATTDLEEENDRSEDETYTEDSDAVTSSSEGARTRRRT
ncbi:hypothetical protein EX895_002398 [Sporisorium graminicola]|uniref:Uncharacterized protein n=1 Tax=Sporisorium graminicola TaxID=280036 RepID=A0A4U7KX24_9BASI|nr:hypothetical protein EX895_002398 [Sporisorium graminicola]TKY88767.1 hypothetical protein EX895_002398 [Sporisorium graminicola]